jgi:MoxR-like ATPase
MLLDARSRLAASPTEAVVAGAGQVILGKERQIRLAMACILARGHLLIEDVPGVGKTTLSHALARCWAWTTSASSSPPTCCPADIIGVSIFDRDSSTFRFHPGPIFAQIILADEINRASPKAQSALLEAMEEHQVTGGGRDAPAARAVLRDRHAEPVAPGGHVPAARVAARSLPHAHQPGLSRRQGGARAAEGRGAAASSSRTSRPPWARRSSPSCSAACRRCRSRRRCLDYVQQIIHHTRHSPRFTQGLSPRAGVAILRAAQAWALMEGRRQVLPEDVQAILPAVVGHRLHGNADAVKGSFDPCERADRRRPDSVDPGGPRSVPS